MAHGPILELSSAVRGTGGNSERQREGQAGVPMVCDTLATEMQTGQAEVVRPAYLAGVFVEDRRNRPMPLTLRSVVEQVAGLLAEGGVSGIRHWNASARRPAPHLCKDVSY